jgi:hypothetical protein
MNEELIVEHPEMGVDFPGFDELEVTKAERDQATVITNEQNNRQIIKVLHEPIAPYLTNTYNILIQLIQGFVLAELLFILSRGDYYNIQLVGKTIVVLSVVALIWHHYLVSNQYLVTRAGAQDTIIPLCLAVLQVLLILAMPLRSYYFSFSLMLITLVSSLVYLNLYTKYKNPIAKEIFRVHFRELGPEFAEDIYSEIINYDKKSSYFLAFVSAVLGLMTIVNYHVQFIPDEFKGYLVIVVAEAIIILLFYFDLKYVLNHSVKLKNYGFRW